jgi:hypothetical protein
MKNKNPYLSCIILWIGAICVALSFSIYEIVSGNLFLAISQLVFIVFDSIYLGWCICKFNAYKELLKTKKALEDGLKQFEELMKMKENEPFKEFEDNAKS